MSSAGEFFSTTASEGCSVMTGGFPTCFKTERVQNIFKWHFDQTEVLMDEYNVLFGQKRHAGHYSLPWCYGQS